MKLKLIFSLLIIVFFNKVKGQDFDYKMVFETIKDSVLIDYPENVYIEPLANYKVELYDFMEGDCPLPLKLLIEFFENGERSKIPYKLNKFIDDEYEDTESRYKIEISNIVNYYTISFCRIILRDMLQKDRHQSLSLAFTRNKVLFIQKHEWIK